MSIQAQKTVPVNEIDTVKQELEAARKRLKELQEQHKQANKLALCVFNHKKTGEEKVGINVQLGQGMPKFFYASQLQELLGMAKQIEAFIQENKETLSWKK